MVDRESDKCLRLDGLAENWRVCLFSLGQRKSARRVCQRRPYIVVPSADPTATLLPFSALADSSCAMLRDARRCRPSMRSPARHTAAAIETRRQTDRQTDRERERERERERTKTLTSSRPPRDGNGRRWRHVEESAGGGDLHGAEGRRCNLAARAA